MESVRYQKEREIEEKKKTWENTHGDMAKELHHTKDQLSQKEQIFQQVEQ